MYLQDLLEHMRLSYDADDPDSVGSALITQRLSKLCRVNFVKDLEYKECKWATKMLPATAFCPLEEDKHWMIFDPARSKLVKKKMEDNNSLGLRLWKKHTEMFDNWGGPNHTTAFYYLAEEHCPLTSQVLDWQMHY
jgi:hypothetical protein